MRNNTRCTLPRTHDISHKNTKCCVNLLKQVTRNKIFLGQIKGTCGKKTSVIQTNSTAESVTQLQCKSVLGSLRNFVSVLVKYVAINTKLICLVDTKYINICVYSVKWFHS